MTTVTTVTEENDKDFQARLINECTEEIFPIKGAGEKDLKKLTTIMKKYEDKIYERFIKRTTVGTLDKKNEKEDLLNASVKYPFVGDASFLTNYNRLLRGYKDETNFHTQQHPQQPHHDVRMPSELGIYQPKNLPPSEQKSYVDTHANSKYYFPQDYEPQYQSTNIYNNKPINDISNQQHLYLSQFDRAGFVDPFGSQQNFNPQNLYGSQIPSQNTGFRGGNIGGGLGASGNYGLQSGLGGGLGMGPQGGYSTPGILGSPHGQSSLNPSGVYNNRFGQPQISDEEIRLRRNIELLGGIDRTIPNMERSLRDNELKNIEQNFRFQNQYGGTNNRLDNLLNPNTMRNAYSPQFETPHNARSQSPLRGDYPDLNRNPLYYSPGRTNYQNYPVETEIKPTNLQNLPPNQNTTIPQSRDPLFEKSINVSTPYKPSFASSKALRTEKAEILNVQYQIPDNWGHHND